MDRWIVVDWEKREVSAETFPTEREAWKETVELARKQGRSPYEWDQVLVNVEAR